MRPESATAKLIRLGFADLETAAINVAQLGTSDEALEIISSAADPDQALRFVTEIVAVDPSVRASDHEMLTRAAKLLGASSALGDHLVRHPSDWVAFAPGAPSMTSQMRQLVLAELGADHHGARPMAAFAGQEALVALRVVYRRLLLSIAIRDVVDGEPMSAIGAELAELADAVLEGALAIARAELDLPDTELAVIGMGKCGGRELNYVSDVDVIFVVGDDITDLGPATKLATAMMRACSAATPEGSIWEVDAALRPEGKAGALVRTLSSHIGYYERWAKTWEYQALLKARTVAGDRELGAAYCDAMLPFVWSAADHEGFVDEAQAMRKRVEEHAAGSDREIKLSPGGLRDVEFSVQLLQLVHGRSDVMLRSSTTLVALESLANWGYVGRDDASTLASAYIFLRTMEHRIQLQRLRRTHIVPDDEVQLRALARSLGYASIDELTDEWKRHAREVRRIHEKLFYRPLLNAVARLDAGEARLSLEAAEERLAALGYADPGGALRHLEALTSGVSRRAAIQRTLLPVMLAWFADAPEPDNGLLGFRRVSDALGATPWYLRLLRDESVAAERMAHVLASSRYVTDLLLRAPESVSMLADDDELGPRTREQLDAEIAASLARHDDPELAISAVRALRRRELLRISVADVLGLLSPVEVSDALTDVTAAAINGGVQIAASSLGELPIRFAVIAMGRFGGGELGYGSDADVIFVHDPLPGVGDDEATKASFAIANELRRLFMVPSTDPPLEIDADLRPEGKNGPLVRSLASYAAYYERWSSTWEAQALLRAVPVAGDANLGAEFTALIDPIRFPANGMDDAEVRDIRRIKARMEAERLPRGADPSLHTKLGRGGLSDVEWSAQLLQLMHGESVSALRTARTLPALAAAAEAGLMSSNDAEQLAQAWVLATGIRNAMMLVRGKATDQVPTDIADLRAISYVLGYSLSDAGRILEDYRRVTRRARAVMDRVFYGLTDTDR